MTSDRQCVNACQWGDGEREREREREMGREREREREREKGNWAHLLVGQKGGICSVSRRRRWLGWEVIVTVLYFIYKSPPNMRSFSFFPSDHSGSGSDPVGFLVTCATRTYYVHPFDVLLVVRYY